MGRLRTRGLRRVRMAAMFRCAGWNVFRALAARKKRGTYLPGRPVRDMAAFLAAFFRVIRLIAHQQACSAASSGRLSLRPWRIAERRPALAA